MVKIKQNIPFIVEYFQLFLESWIIILFSFVPGLFDIVSVYICPFFPYLCPNTLPKFIPWVSVLIGFVVANIIVFDKQKKKIILLEKEISQLKRTIPELELSVSDNKKSHDFQSKIYIKQPNIEKEPEIAQSTYAGWISPQQLSVMLGGTIDYFYNLQQSAAKDRQELEDWERDVKRYSEVEIKLSNNGNVPAQNIDVHLDFPKEIIPMEDLPEKPGTGPMDTFLSHMHIDSYVMVKGQKVSLHEKKLKHGYVSVFEKFYIKSSEVGRITKDVRFEITADNIPQPQIGKLSFTINSVAISY